MKFYVASALFLITIIMIAGCQVQPAPNAEEQSELDIIKELQDIEDQLTENKTNISAEAGQGVVRAQDSDIDTSSLKKIEVSETSLVVLSVDSEDEDNDEVTYAYSAPLDASGSWKTNYGDAGEYIVTITATDGINTVEEKILLVIIKKNVAPTISNIPEELSVNEGEVLTLNPEVSDENNDKIMVTFSVPLDENGVWEIDHKSAGTYTLTVVASDGEEETEFITELTVVDVNVPPSLELVGVEGNVITSKEGDEITLQLAASDEDNDKVSVSISDPLGDDGVWKTGYTDHGEYEITISASDGKDTVSKNITLVVEDVNVPPKILDIRKD